MDEGILDGISCYLEYAGETYKTHSFDTREHVQEDTCHNYLYKVEEGNIKEVYKTCWYIDEERKEEFNEIMEKEGQKAKNEGSYAFFEIKFEEE